MKFFLTTLAQPFFPFSEPLIWSLIIYCFVTCLILLYCTVTSSLLSYFISMCAYLDLPTRFETFKGRSVYTFLYNQERPTECCAYVSCPIIWWINISLQLLCFITSFKKKLTYDYIFSMVLENEIQAIFFLSDQMITHSYLKH